MKFRSYEQALSALVGSGREPDDEDRAVATLIAARCAGLKDVGYRCGLWRPGRNKPAARKIDGYGVALWEWDGTQVGWLDHPYTLRVPGGRLLFVSEPYRLDEEGLRNLAVQVSRGFRVSIQPEWAIHYPSRTIAVILERPT